MPAPAVRAVARRSAPPVSLALAGDARWQAVSVGLHGLAAATVMAWAVSHVVPDAGAPATAALALLAGAVGAVAGRDAVRAVPGSITWDGEQWSWSAGDAPAVLVAVSVAVDGGDWLLLRLDGTGVRAWRAVHRRSAPTRWHLARTALFAARPATDPSPAWPT